MKSHKSDGNKENKLTDISVRYSFSKPTFPGSKNSPWESAEVALTETVPENTDALEYAEVLFGNIKLQVTAELGLALEKVDGVLVPVLDVADFPTKAESTSSTPKTDPNELPTIVIDGETWADYRNSEEKQNNAMFPDFKTLDGEKARWLTKKDGSTTKFYDDAKAAGVLQDA